MFINLSYINKATPATAMTAFNVAAAILNNLITDNITVNISVDWTGSGGTAGAAPTAGLIRNYSTVRGILTSTASPGDTSFSTLPDGDSIQGF